MVVRLVSSLVNLIRRVDPKNRTLGEFVRDEIVEPLDVEFYISLP